MPKPILPHTSFDIASLPPVMPMPELTDRELASRRARIRSNFECPSCHHQWWVEPDEPMPAGCPRGCHAAAS